MFDDGRPAAPDDDAHGVEAAAGGRVAVTVEPEASDPLDLAAFPRGDRLEGVAEAGTGAGFHLDERDEAVARHNEIDLAVTEAEITRQDRIAVLAKVPRRNPLALDTQVVGRNHLIRPLPG